MGKRDSRFRVHGSLNRDAMRMIDGLQLARFHVLCAKAPSTSWRRQGAASPPGGNPTDSWVGAAGAVPTTTTSTLGRERSALGALLAALPRSAHMGMIHGSNQTVAPGHAGRKCNDMVATQGQDSGQRMAIVWQYQGWDVARS